MKTPEEAAKKIKNMKKEIVFKDTVDDSTISVSIDSENRNYILATKPTAHQVWLSPQDFWEFLDECQRFYQDNEMRKSLNNQ